MTQLPVCTGGKAPSGGAISHWNGLEYKGGEFMPESAMAKAQKGLSRKAKRKIQKLNNLDRITKVSLKPFSGLKATHKVEVFNPYIRESAFVEYFETREEAAAYVGELTLAHYEAREDGLDYIFSIDSID